MKRWSQEVTEHSNSLDLDNGVFALDSASAVAQSLKRSADRSKRRKASPFQSAMSMLNFYLNRAGGTLSGRRKRVLENAKTELRKLYRERDRRLTQRRNGCKEESAVDAEEVIIGPRQGRVEIWGEGSEEEKSVIH